MTTYSDDTDGIFYRINEDGNAYILYISDGVAVTSLDENVYPVDSDLSARYDHASGIVLTIDDAKSVGIPHEYDCE